MSYSSKRSNLSSTLFMRTALQPSNRAITMQPAALLNKLLGWRKYREKVKALEKEWAVLAAQAPPGKKLRRRSAKERLRRGLRTPEDAFRRPILEALVECGGEAPMGKVLEAVEKKMRNRLTEYDFLPLPSDPRSVRWRNTAQWCRNSLVREGLLKRDSPHGIWEISESGRKALEKEAS